MGIGLGIAERLHEAGASVLLADLDTAAAQAAVEASTSAARTAPSRLRPTSLTGKRRGDGRGRCRSLRRPGHLVNNAGIYPIVRFTEMEPALFERVMRVNLIGTFLCMQAAARQMIEQGRGGKIINVTSVDALHPSMVGLAHYDASKHGAWGLTKNVALELSEYGITVNAIAPGAVATPGAGVAR